VTDGADKKGHDAQGRFLSGNPGGPGGARRRRSAELRRAAEEAVTPEHVQALIRKALRLGLEGNLAAMRLVFERVCGRTAEAPVESDPLSIQLPPLHSTADCNAAIQQLVDGVCQGSIRQDAAKLLIETVQGQARILGHKDPDAPSSDSRGRALLDALLEMKQRGGLEPS
jgi:hypothetical protein